MAFKLLIVVSSGGSRLDLAKRVAEEASKLGAKSGIVFVGNSLYSLRRQAGIAMEGLRGVVVMAHEMGLAERGITASEIVGVVRLINDDELLDLMIGSEKALCI